MNSNCPFLLQKIAERNKKKQDRDKGDFECCFCQGHTEPTGTYGTVLPGWGEGGIQKVAERFLHCGTMAKETIWKSVAKSEIQSCHKLHPQHDNTCLGGNSQFQLLPGAEGLDNTSGVLTFTTST